MHWTYEQSTGIDLKQGDILLQDDGLRSALKNVHAWFAHEKYLGFIVLTQTCDLVRRGEQPCKAPHITIAAIRPLRQVLLSLISRQCKCVGGRYFFSAERKKAMDLLDRIINQNESANGLFYLHPETQVGIAEECVAMLRVSVALRANEHYQTLLAARRGGLKIEFESKLGWLCGNLYSRVAVTDWKEDESRQNVATQLIDELLSGANPLLPIFSDSKALYKEYKQSPERFEGLSETEATALFTGRQGKKYKTVAVEAIGRIMESQNIDPRVCERVINTISGDRQFLIAVREGSIEEPSNP